MLMDLIVNSAIGHYDSPVKCEVIMYKLLRGYRIIYLSCHHCISSILHEGVGLKGGFLYLVTRWINLLVSGLASTIVLYIFGYAIEICK